MNQSIAKASDPWLGVTLTMMKHISTYTENLYRALPKDSRSRPLHLINIGILMQIGLEHDINKIVDNPPPSLLQNVTFGDGYPIVNGIAVWNQIEGEPSGCYDLFKQYRMMKSSQEVRSISRLSKLTNVEVTVLNRIRSIFNWAYRIQAYEDYRQYERDQLLEERRLQVQGKHARAANTLFDITMKQIEKNQKIFSPKDLIKMLETAVKLERLSIGLSGDTREAIYTPGANGVNVSINNVSNNTDSSGAVIVGGKDINTGSSGNNDDDKQNLSEILNVMSQMGILQEDNIIEAECVEVNND